MNQDSYKREVGVGAILCECYGRKFEQWKVIESYSGHFPPESLSASTQNTFMEHQLFSKRLSSKISSYDYCPQIVCSLLYSRKYVYRNNYWKKSEYDRSYRKNEKSVNHVLRR